MNSNALSKACKSVYSRYPRLEGKSPKVSQQADGRYLLIFGHSGGTATGKTIEQTIRAVVDENGNLIKVSSSR